MSSTEALPVIDNAWVARQRGARNAVQVGRAYGVSVEPERQRDGTIDDVLTVLTVNRECPLRCVMCDLWKNTLQARSPAGSVADQIDAALAAHPGVRRIKIYNAGSFFDRGSIPPEDVERIVDATRAMQTIVVESHPSMIGMRAAAFAEAVGPERLEVGMGLETVHPDVLPRLNKRMTLDDFQQATRRLLDAGCSVRAFVLVRPPFLTEAEGLDWAIRSVAWARTIGVECNVLIPVRGGNGAMEELARVGHFAPPRLATLERALDACLAANLAARPAAHTVPSEAVNTDASMNTSADAPPVDAPQGRVFADLWDAKNFGAGDPIAAERIARMATMNRSQVLAAPVAAEIAAP